MRAAERAALPFDDDRFPHNNRKASARLNYVILDPDNTLMHSSGQFIERLNASTRIITALSPPLMEHRRPLYRQAYRASLL
jgi:hypothetical protein